MKSLFKWHSIQENVNVERGGHSKEIRHYMSNFKYDKILTNKNQF